MPQETGLSGTSARTAEPHGPRHWLARLCLAGIAAVMAGCAGLTPSTQEEVPATPIPAEEPAVKAPAPAPEPAETPPEPEPEPADVAPQAFGGKAVIVLSDRSPPFERVAAELSLHLAKPLLYDLSDKSQTREEAFARIAESDAEVVIAIGFAAAEAASALSTVPVVYCQVFNFKVRKDDRIDVKGVAALPPLSLQIEEWTKADPELRRIGAILGDGHDTLIAEARDATSAMGLTFQHEIAASDRETLYLFKRMAPDIDGFWLFPDNRVLSLPVLRQMMDVAVRHGVRIAVFNEALLELGAAVSTAAVESDIAETALAVAQQVVHGDGKAVPDLTPVGKVHVRQAEASGSRWKGLASGRNGSPKGRL
jgi:hypothetical protein